jgi:translation elongation factor EF-Tu-like GTPase
MILSIFISLSLYMDIDKNGALLRGVAREDIERGQVLAKPKTIRSSYLEGS